MANRLILSCMQHSVLADVVASEMAWRESLTATTPKLAGEAAWPRQMSFRRATCLVREGFLRALARRPFRLPMPLRQCSRCGRRLSGSRAMSCRERRCCRSMRLYKKPPRIEIKLTDHVADPGIWRLGIMTSRPSSMLFQERGDSPAEDGWSTVRGTPALSHWACAGNPSGTRRNAGVRPLCGFTWPSLHLCRTVVLHSVGSQGCAPPAEAPSQCGFQSWASHRRREILPDSISTPSKSRPGTGHPRHGNTRIAYACVWKRKDKGQLRVQIMGPKIVVMAKRK
jgi:hypothetical protein